MGSEILFRLQHDKTPAAMITNKNEMSRSLRAKKTFIRKKMDQTEQFRIKNFRQ